MLNRLKFGEVSVRNTIQKWIAIIEVARCQCLQVILRYSDQGDGKYAADPAYGKNMSLWL